jgi:hypothetical protein
MTEWRRFLKRLDFEHPVTPKSKGLVALGVVALLHALGYFMSPGRVTPLPAGLTLIAEIIPVRAWALVWAIAGLGAIWAALWKPIIARHPMKNLFQSIMVAMFTLWGLSYLLSWLLTMSGRTWVVGFLYLGIAVHINYTRQLYVGVHRNQMDPSEPCRKGGIARWIRRSH